MSANLPSQFVFCTCQHGAEGALKNEVAERVPNWRLAFSRPGFVTFKLAENSSPELARPIFARAVGWSIGKVGGDELQQLATAAWQLPALSDLGRSITWDDIHVWQRDQTLPGERGFVPGPSPLALEAENLLRQTAPTNQLALRSTPSVPRHATRRLGRVLDVVLVEPGEWWIGYHTATSRTERWPGGVIPIELPEHAVSRAYLKIVEALEWSGLPTRRGDQWVEIGCAPGGASQALLERGMIVQGIDPAEVHPDVLSHKNFTHIRRRTQDVPRKLLREAAWLASDLNVAPNYTLDAVESLVTHRDISLRGLVLTLKLADWKLAAPSQLEPLLERVKSWGYEDLRLRQLAHNRREICLVALRTREQRRVARTRGNTSTTTREGSDAPRSYHRRDAGHSRPSRPHLDS